MEILSSTPAPKRTRAARPKSSATAHGETAAAVPKKPTARKKKTEAAVASADVGGMIATAAYYLAERRNFAPGHELEDWIEAEKQIKTLLK